MSDESKEPEDEALEPELPRVRAEDNAWYLLATVYGVPRVGDHDLREKNRIAWNRYFAADLDDETRSRLIRENRHTREELAPYSPEDVGVLAIAFAERCNKSGKYHALPAHSAGIPIDFSNVNFDREAFFEGRVFIGHPSFEKANFSCGARFRGATFCGVADFHRTKFSSWADFRGVASTETAYFHRATFSVEADFMVAAFSGGGTVFKNAIFTGEAKFRSTTFSTADFSGATFSSWADFCGAVFSHDAIFEGVTFSKRSDFGHLPHAKKNSFFGGKTTFINAKMKGETSFEGAIFEREPPSFSGAELHEGTVWPGREAWPIPKDEEKAKEFVRAYERLKLEMDRLKKHEDEFNFFALELQSRRVLLGWWDRLILWIYALLSDYGRSSLRPVLALVIVAALGSVVFTGPLSFEKSLVLSVANTFSILGLRKEFVDPRVINVITPSFWLTVFSAFQAVCGMIFLFLFVLGIRNKFRMK